MPRQARAGAGAGGGSPAGGGFFFFGGGGEAGGPSALGGGSKRLRMRGGFLLLRLEVVFQELARSVSCPIPVLRASSAVAPSLCAL